jgi:hypothetical protein
LALIVEDPGHPVHARIIGESAARRVLLVAFLERGADGVRIISARRATRHVALEGIAVQVGRGRPRRILETGGTTPRSVRFPDATWALLERRAKTMGLTLHAALREAILAWARRVA